MKASTHIRSRFAVAAAAVLVIGIFAGSGQAASGSADRSQVLNEIYGLGDGPVTSDPAYLVALRNQAEALNDAIRNQAAPAADIRSQVLNEIYGLGDGPVTSDPAYLVALRNQAEALNDAIRNQAAPTEVVVGGGFDWADAGIGVAAAFGAILLAGVGVLGLRRRGHVAQPDF
jgi:hypothetical protein